MASQTRTEIVVINNSIVDQVEKQKVTAKLFLKFTTEPIIGNLLIR